MKRLFPAIITLLVLLTVSCGRNKGMFILHGTVQDGTDSILVVGIDNRFENADTIFCTGGQFTWKFRPDTVTTLVLILPDGRHHPVFAEKNVEAFITIPADTALFSVSGGACNDAYQSFYLASAADTTLDLITARIDSFITADPFSEVTPYLIYDCLVLKHHAKESVIEPLIKRMSGNMQDAPYLVSLKNEFNRDIPGNIYMDNVSVKDTTGHKYEFLQVGGASNHLLVLIWASWMDRTALELRDTLGYFLDKYNGRYFNVTDVSIDVNAQKWKETVAADTVRWISYNDPLGWESKLVRSSNLQTAPAFLLFTGTKRLVYKTTSIEDLDKELDRTLSKVRIKDDAKRLTKDRPK